MDTAQWPQEILVKPMEEMIPNTCSSSAITTTATTTTQITNINNTNNSKVGSSNNQTSSTSLERKVRPQKDHAVNCPRCNSTNTKFCYYNNYSLTQPRYFCKTCRRYWTEGGSLRNIPVGGGSRKNKRSSSSSSNSSSSLPSKKISSHDLVASVTAGHHQQSHHHFVHHHLQNPNLHNLHHQGQDLNLGFPPPQQEFRSLSEFMQLPSIDSTKTQIPNSINNNNNTTSSNNNSTNGAGSNHHLSALELLNGLTSSRGLTPFMPLPVSIPDHPDGSGGGGGGAGVYSAGFPLQDYKPSLNFSLVEGLGNGYGSIQGEVHQQHQQVPDQQQQTANGRLLFPFEDLKQSTSGDHNNNNTNNNSANNNSGDNNNNHDQNGEQGDVSTPGYWSGMLGSGGSW